MTTTETELDLTPLHEEVRDVARRFAVECVAPQAAILDREARFPYDLVEEMGALGFFGLMIPESHGGTGLGSLAYSLVVGRWRLATAASPSTSPTRRSAPPASSTSPTRR